MTLVVTALTSKHVVQVSDRRIVTVNPSGLVINTIDEGVKAVITPSYACSYTGTADLGSGDTAEWIANELSDHMRDGDYGIGALVQALDSQTAKQGRTGQFLSIVCAGWFEFNNVLHPSIGLITNQDRATGRILSNFSVTWIQRSPGRQSVVYACGQNLTSHELRNLMRSIERLCINNRVTARAIAQLLTECVRSVAKSPDRKAYVSEDVLVTSLPHYEKLKHWAVVGQLLENYYSVTCVKAGPSRIEVPGGPIIVGDKAAVQALIPQSGSSRREISMKIVRMAEEGKTLRVMFFTDPPLEAWGWPAIGALPAPSDPPEESNPEATPAKV